MMTDFSPAAYLNLSESPHAVLFEGEKNVWDVLGGIGDYLRDLNQRGVLGEVLGTPWIGPDVFIGEGTVIEPGAMIKGPAWIGKNCVIRHGCYIRENVIAGDGCVLGNSCEFKNCVIFNRAEVPHFNYVGDSVLGFRAHLGAGVILSNVRLDRTEVRVCADGDFLSTGLRKFGAIVGDRTEVGCNSVLSPGSVLGRDCILYPGTQWRGVLPANSIVKLRQEQVIVKSKSQDV